MTEAAEGRDAPGDAQVLLAPRADANAGEARSPAQIFAARRAELGLSLEDVAHQLKFAARQIEALEGGEFEKLPGGTFARGMVRGYARLLKLDPAPILAQMASSGMAPQVAPEEAVSLRTPIPFSEGGKHVNLVYAVLSAVILAVVAFYAVEWYQERNGTAKLAFVSAARTLPAEEAEPNGKDVRAGAATMPDTQGANEAQPEVLSAVRPAVQPAVQPSIQAQTPSPAAPAAQSSEPSAAKAAKSVASPNVPAAGTLPLADLPASKRRIVMHFDKESWVEVRAGNGAMLVSQINPAGSEKVIEGDPPFTLVIGNAASVRLTYNDQPVDLRPYFRVDVARLKLD